MKDMFIDMMVTMMPFMKPFMWFGVIVAGIGLLLILSQLTMKKPNQKAITWSTRIVFITSAFFLAAQLAGTILNMPPTINFGDASKFEFVLVSFWQIGVAFLVAATVLKFGGKQKPAEQA